MTTLPKYHLISFVAIALLSVGCGDKSVNTETPAVAAPPVESTGATVDTPIEAANPNEQEAALLAAAAKGDTAIVKTLLDKGVNINVRDRETSSPLANAIWFGHVDTVKALIDGGADLNIKKKDGATPLLLSVWSKHPEITEILKKAGAK